MVNKKQKARRVLCLCAAALVLCTLLAVWIARSGHSANTLPQETTASEAALPAAEEISIPGQRGSIPATVQLPAGSTQNVPLVILCHGFTGNREGDGHFAPLAQALAEQSIACVRLDFAGCGDSTEPFTSYTLANMTDDVDSVIAYMQQTYATGATALVGHSMGGRLASLYPQSGSYDTAALVLWSPANGAGLQGLEFLDIEDFSHVEEMATEAEANGQVSAWGVEISAEFVREMRESDPNAALAAANLPTLLTYSGNDTVLSADTQTETMTAVQALEQGTVVTEPFAAGNHNYLSEDETVSAELDTALRQVTVEFLTQQLLP